VVKDVSSRKQEKNREAVINKVSFFVSDKVDLGAKDKTIGDKLQLTRLAPNPVFRETRFHPPERCL
jgi:hypothetical protein